MHFNCFANFTFRLLSPILSSADSSLDPFEFPLDLVPPNSGDGAPPADDGDAFEISRPSPSAAVAAAAAAAAAAAIVSPLTGVISTPGRMFLGL